MSRERPLDVRMLGCMPYGAALELQSDLVVQRRAGDIPDTLLLLEHPHVITLGSSSRPEHILLGPGEREARGIELFETGRGGDVTYHGPGQLVAYPILDLKPDRKDLHRYLRDLEAVLIDVASDFGIEAERSEGFTGAWTAGGKIAAIGVRVSSGWITSHGLALNVSTNLDFFEAIVPCGIQDRSVTSLERELGRTVPMHEAREALIARFVERFDYPPVVG